MSHRNSTAAAIAGSIALALVCILHSACGGSNADQSAKKEDDFQPNLNDPKLKERLGDDNGYGLAVLYGSDIHGSLETCG